MEWIFKMIEPVIKDCATPDEARAAVVKWGKFQEPRDAAAGLLAIEWLNAQYESQTPQP